MEETKQSSNNLKKESFISDRKREIANMMLYSPRDAAYIRHGGDRTTFGDIPDGAARELIGTVYEILEVIAKRDLAQIIAVEALKRSEEALGLFSKLDFNF